MKKKNSFMSATLMCCFLIIAFHFNKNGIQWFWTGQEMVPLILGISALIFGTFWFFTSKSRTNK